MEEKRDGPELGEDEEMREMRLRLGEAFAELPGESAAAAAVLKMLDSMSLRPPAPDDPVSESMDNNSSALAVERVVPSPSRYATRHPGPGGSGDLDVDLDVDLVDVDLVDILFVVLLMSLRGKFCEKRYFSFFVVSIADPKKGYFHGLEPQDHARTLSFEKSYPTH